MFSTYVHTLLVFLLLAVLVFLSVSAVLVPVMDWLRVGVNFLDYPFVAVFGFVKNFSGILWNVKNIAQENVLLTKQVEKLTADVAALERVGEENVFLREGLGFRTSQRRELIPVGVVAEVAENTSAMDLLTSSKVAINALVVPGGASGLVRGEHGLGLTFDLVSQNEVINPGDELLTSGLGGQFPKDLLIGEVSRITSGESELFQRASVLPATNYRDLNFLFVLKP
ncbi:MAG: Cell shape-determining protein MreC [Parcubacteria group bacterium GW2011_GWA2_52_8]|nr:MAG: Cell shape-determining protein MreC [Parcubacteria group bacterium GW2011_GWA2_52_8]